MNQMETLIMMKFFLGIVLSWKKDQHLILIFNMHKIYNQV